MSIPNPNDTKLEQQRSDTAIKALEEQTEGNNTKDTDTDTEAEHEADNLENTKKDE